MWSLHGTDRQTPRALLRHHRGGSRGEGHYYYRGAVREQPSSGATGLDRRTGTAVRLLPIPGQIMTAVSLLERKPNPTDKDIDRGMLNLCRCGTYTRVRKAIHRAADMLKEAS